VVTEPSFDIDRLGIGGQEIAVDEQTLASTAFSRTIRFAPRISRLAPRLLVVAPLSGHFAALLRDMVLALLPEHDVHVIAWRNARDVPLQAGAFSFEHNISHVLQALRGLGEDVHLVGICQSAVPALAATALMAAAGDVAQPRSLTLIDGPVDARINPTRIDRATRQRPLNSIESTSIRVVPYPCVGAGRRVYPAAMQQMAFWLYLCRHIAEGGELYRKLIADDGLAAIRHPFIPLFLSTMDLPAEYFLDVVRLVFQKFALPRGALTWLGEAVDPAAISRTALMTIESERGDVTGRGQTFAAHGLCSRIPPSLRRHFVLKDGGHFAVFHGARWRQLVLPRMRDFIRMAEAMKRTARKRSPARAAAASTRV
jgi:poly(3-hydroxybutyrate) depolymerase